MTHFDESNLDDAATIYLAGRSWVAFETLRNVLVPTLRELAKETNSAPLVVSTLDYILAELDSGTKKEANE
jgi:hypothetical protein